VQEGQQQGEVARPEAPERPPHRGVVYGRSDEPGRQPLHLPQRAVEVLPHEADGAVPSGGEPWFSPSSGAVPRGRNPPDQPFGNSKYLADILNFGAVPGRPICGANHLESPPVWFSPPTASAQPPLRENVLAIYLRVRNYSTNPTEPKNLNGSNM